MSSFGSKQNPKPHSSASLVFFLGVGGSGRSPLNPPTPRYEGAGVRVNLETKRKFIIDYREAMKIVVKYSLRRARGQGLGGY